VLLKQQDPVMAKMYLEKALAMDPRNYMTHTLLGQSYRALGQTAQASHEFQTAEQIQADEQPKIETVK
jgi:Tfp pilus assembly protein PilF